METTLSLTLHHAQKVTEMDPRPKHKSLNYKARRKPKRKKFCNSEIGKYFFSSIQKPQMKI